MSAYWKAWLALAAGLLILIVVAVFFPHHETVLKIAAVQTVVTALAVIAGPKNTPKGL